MLSRASLNALPTWISQNKGTTKRSSQTATQVHCFKSCRPKRFELAENHHRPQTLQASISLKGKFGQVRPREAFGAGILFWGGVVWSGQSPCNPPSLRRCFQQVRPLGVPSAQRATYPQNGAKPGAAKLKASGLKTTWWPRTSNDVSAVHQRTAWTWACVNTGILPRISFGISPKRCRQESLTPRTPIGLRAAKLQRRATCPSQAAPCGNQKRVCRLFKGTWGSSITQSCYFLWVISEWF